MTSRIMCDCRIARPKAQAFKQAWFENFARGKRADIMILAMAGKDCLGFCSVLQKDDQVIIDLIAVAESARRQGVAKRLLSEFLGLPAQIFGVSTQKNNAAQSLYQQAGFTKKAEFVAMHWHG
ncbi:MAG: GNAT family N-acetyltransferase [Pseudomonadota bacterium]